MTFAMLQEKRDLYGIDGTKIHLHPDRIAQWQSNDRNSVFPLYVEISPVGHCNHRCTFCAVDYIGYKIRRLDTARLKDNLTDMAASGVRSVMFAGEGEPLLHPDIAEITRHAANRGIDISFTTNAVALTDRFIEEALSSVAWIKVSLNAGNKETYAKIHQTKETDWDRVWDNINRAVLRSVGNGRRTAIGIQSLVLPDNIDSIPELISRAKEAGVDYVVLKPYSQHKKSQTRTYADTRYSGLLTSLEQMAEKESGRGFNVVCRSGAMTSWDAQEPSYDKCCSTPFFWAYIMADGSVYGCSAYLLDDRFRYGNINDQKFSDIWLGDKRKSCIDYVENKLDIKECRVNCRMNKTNEYLWKLQQDQKNPHKNFI